MSDLVITGTVLVVPQTNSQNNAPRPFIAGEDLDQGQPVYLDVTVVPNVWKRGVSTDLTKAQIQAITVNEAKQGQYVVGVNGGQITLGTTTGLIASMQYILSNNTGKIKPYCDITAGEYVMNLFYVEQDGVTCTLNFAFPGVFRTTTSTTTTTTTTT